MYTTIITRNIIALEDYYGIPFGYNGEQKQYEAYGKNKRVIMIVSTIGKGELFGFSVGDILPSDLRPTA